MTTDVVPDTSTNPYVGPRSFQRGEPLYGRDRETLDLVDLLVAERIVVLHSPSGAGKTSLINSRLISQLKEDRFEVLPVVRLNQDLPPELLTGAPAPNRYVLGTLLALEDGVPTALQKPAERLAGMTLAQYLDEWPDLDNIPGNEVLIFDQFEEIITSDPTDLAAKKEFFTQLGLALRDRSLWALFSMREDFLAELDPFTPLVPTRFATRYRLDLLTPAAALEAITRPAESRGVQFDSAAASQLVDDLRRVRVQRPQEVVTELGPFVEPVQLQVVCQGIWDRHGAGVAGIGPSDINAGGDVNQALADFYAKCLATVAAGGAVSERLLRSWVEHELVTPQGFRGQTSTGPLGDVARDKPILSALTAAHLLRAEIRRGTTWYELGHDRLIDPVQSDNTRWNLENLTDLQRRAEWWKEHGRPGGFLLGDTELAQAEQDWGPGLQKLPEHEREFLLESRREQQRVARERRAARLIRRWLYVAIAVSMTTLLALAWAGWAMLEMREQRALAVARLWAGEADRRVDSQPSVAILAGLQALSAGDRYGVDPPPGLVTALARVTHASRQLNGHAGPVSAVAISPDGSLLATASADKTVRLWDTATGQSHGEPLAGHDGTVTGVAFSPDGRLLATSSADRTVRLWDVATGQPHGQPLKGHGNSVSGVAISPDGVLVASAGADQTLRLWDVATGSPRGLPIRGHSGPLTSVAFGPGGTLMATAGADRTVRLWDVATGQPRGTPLLGHTNAVNGVAFSPDGALLASAGSDEEVRLWDVATGQGHGQPLLGHGSFVYGVAFSPNGAVLASAHADQTVRLWDVATGEPSGEPIIAHDGAVSGVAFSPKGALLASASADQTARLWDTVNTYSLSQQLAGDSDTVSGVAFSPDGSLLASAGGNGTVRLWDTASRRPRGGPFTGHTGPVNAVAFSPDGAVLASAGADQTVRLWDVATGQPRGPLLGRHGDAVNAVAFSRDGALLATASADRTVRLWDVASGRPHGPPMSGHGDAVNAVAFSPDSALLASGGADRTVRLWDTATGRPHGPPITGHSNYVSGVAFSPDGSLLATASADRTVRLWDTAGQPHGAPLVGHAGRVYGVVFNRSGSLLASAGGDKTVRLWDPVAGQPWGAPFTGHTAAVLGVAFSPDGSVLASGGADHSVRLWQSTFTDWIAAGCRLVNRNLSSTEWGQIAPDLPYERTCPNLPSGEGEPAEAPAARYSHK